MNSTNLFVGMFFSCCGFAYFTYGRKLRRMVPTLTGIGLMVYPYFISHLLPMILIGVAGLGLPWVLRE